jgi:LysM repeat protein
MILAAVVVVAGGVWGIYAWKYARPVGAGVSAARPVDLAAGDAKAGGDHLTTLRATPVGAGEALEPEQMSGLSSSIGANRPSSLGGGDDVEMTLVRKNATKGAAPTSEKPSPPVVRPSPGLPSPQPSPEGRGGQTEAQVQEGKAYLAKGDLVAARVAFSSALDRGVPTGDEEFVRRELTRISNALLFSRATNTNDPLTGVHAIAAGESIHAIARGHKITEELMASINGVSEPNKLAVGQRLKVIEGPFRAVISKSRHRLDIYLGEVFVQSFRVGLGTNGGTPTGAWVVRNKLSNPDWTDPRNGRHYLADDPDNPIGERWIGLEGVSGEALGKQGFGIHGTIDPKSIGENLSMGCIRLAPEDIKRVYDLLVERHSQVEIKS